VTLQALLDKLFLERERERLERENSALQVRGLCVNSRVLASSLGELQESWMCNKALCAECRGSWCIAPSQVERTC
jgi:hypothetical protein